MHEPSDKLLEQCVSVDIEVDPKTARIFAFAAVQRDVAPPIVCRKGELEGALDRLERVVANSDHLIGHNILRHDLPHLAAARPRLAELFGAPIDTLWLNPLAFPRNPYHHLVKHYHAVLERPVVPDPAGLAGCPPHYVTPDLKLVDLSWAGRLNDGHPAIAAISAARVGDPVTLAADGAVWIIRNAKGQTLGRMARAYNAPEGLEFLRGEIGAIVRWRKSDNKEEFRSTIRRDEWEAILPELVFG